MAELDRGPFKPLNLCPASLNRELYMERTNLGSRRFVFSCQPQVSGGDEAARPSPKRNSTRFVSNSDVGPCHRA